MDYQFRSIEQKWQQHWKESGAYKVSNDFSKPKFYVLDMFPYPSGAGLHVGHPLGYIASDIYSRFKRLKGFNVLHPMGYDAFGLPAEQYAIEHGVHPAVSTVQNIDNFRKQLDNIGFSYDWSREIRTCEPQYYKWTQWIFLQLFNSYFNRDTQKAEPIGGLLKIFESAGNAGQTCPANDKLIFTAEQWTAFSEKEQHDILMQYRLAFCGYGEVNWCEALGTVLANDEVVNGVSERGGHSVVKKKLRQWYLRITEYADRLITGLDQIEFSDAMKEMQSNWIGKSYGAEISFETFSDQSKQALTLTVYTTRPDTIFGVDFMVVAPEHELIEQITTAEQKEAVAAYIAYVNSRSDRERQAEKKITGCFTGAFAINPFNKKQIPIWISEYVLAGYGTGAIMAVPCGDERDFKFAHHFNIPVTNIIGDAFNGSEANATKDAVLTNSDFLNGMVMRNAIAVVIDKLVELGIGKKKVNFKMRDAAFSRQRYWGEPFPIIWKNGIAYPLAENELPLLLPEVESYSAGPEGEGPLANIPEWKEKMLETNTMPGYAGSSWYFLRYMDSGHIGFEEPFKKLLNQGMITGSSRFIYYFELTGTRKDGTGDFISTGLMISFDLIKDYINGQDTPTDFFERLISKSEYLKELSSKVIFSGSNNNRIRVNVELVDGIDLDVEKFIQSKKEFVDIEFIYSEDKKFICESEVEKMSKSKFNTVNPDLLVEKYGADTFRMYEMFLGPVEQSKPWDTKGIEGVHRFLKKLWRLFFDELKGKVWNLDKPTEAELKVLHKTIKKIEEDTERYSFNTAVSGFMICVNELADLKCNKKEILEQLLILLTPYAPHISEELWSALGNTGSILAASFPVFNPAFLTESAKDYPVSINGKLRANITIALDASEEQVKEMVLSNASIQKWIINQPIKKFIFVKGRMINVVI